MEGLIVSVVILGMFLVVIIAILIASIITKDWFNIIIGSFFGIILSIFEISIISEIKNTQPEPTALDVYRGLTELEITSVNGVPKDTVVVFKK